MIIVPDVDRFLEPVHEVIDTIFELRAVDMSFQSLDLSVEAPVRGDFAQVEVVNRAGEDSPIVIGHEEVVTFDVASFLKSGNDVVVVPTQWIDLQIVGVLAAIHQPVQIVVLGERSDDSRNNQYGVPGAGRHHDRLPAGIELHPETDITLIRDRVIQLQVGDLAERQRIPIHHIVTYPQNGVQFPNRDFHHTLIVDRRGERDSPNRLAIALERVIRQKRRVQDAVRVQLVLERPSHANTGIGRIQAADT